MKMMKVFEPHFEMPEHIKKAFFELYGEGKGNDCYLSVTIEPYDYEECKDGGEIHKYDTVVVWLMTQGCALNETVLINHSW